MEKQRGKSRVRFSFNFDADEEEEEDDDAEAESGHYDGTMATPAKKAARGKQHLMLLHHHLHHRYVK